MVTYQRDPAAKSPVLIWGNTELSFRVAVEIGRYLPVLWAFSGEPVGQPEGITALADSRLSKVTGTCGDFTVQIETGSYLMSQVVGAIVVFPEPACDIAASIKAAGEAENPLTMVLALEKVRPGEFQEIVHQALMLSSKGHQVYLVVDDVQVSFPGGEELCQEARQAGVIFLKDTVLSFVDKKSGSEPEQHTAWNISSDAGYGEWFNQTVYLYNDSLGPAKPLVIEADRVWCYDGARAGSVSKEALKLLGIGTDRQEYYPFRTRRKGILVVDPGWGEPFTEEETITCLKVLLQSYLDGDRPPCNYEIQPDLCALCLTCYRTCPHNAVRLGQKASNLYGQAMLIDPVACFNCGRCYAECPAEAIRIILPQDRGSCMVLACENSGGPLLKDAGINGKLFPCAGSIGITDILKACQPGVDRLVIMTCRDGKCQHGSGGKRLSSRVGRLNRLLKSLSRPVHVEVMQVSAQDRVEEILKEG